MASRLSYSEHNKSGKGPAADQKTILLHGGLLHKLRAAQENLAFKTSDLVKTFSSIAEANATKWKFDKPLITSWANVMATRLRNMMSDVHEAERKRATVPAWMSDLPWRQENKQPPPAEGEQNEGEGDLEEGEEDAAEEEEEEEENGGDEQEAADADDPEKKDSQMDSQKFTFGVDKEFAVLVLTCVVGRPSGNQLLGLASAPTIRLDVITAITPPVPPKRVEHTRESGRKCFDVYCGVPRLGPKCLFSSCFDSVSGTGTATISKCFVFL